MTMTTAQPMSRGTRFMQCVSKTLVFSFYASSSVVVFFVHTTKKKEEICLWNIALEGPWQVINAYYIGPRLTKSELASPDFDVHELLDDPLIRACLGEAHQVCHPTAAALCKDLGRFVANSDNASLTTKAEGVDSEQQLWPLVDKVDIFVKADVLSTGAVIRDMVGLGVSSKSSHLRIVARLTYFSVKARWPRRKFRTLRPCSYRRRHMRPFVRARPGQASHQ